MCLSIGSCLGTPWSVICIEKEREMGELAEKWTEQTEPVTNSDYSFRTIYISINNYIYVYITLSVYILAGTYI